MALSTEIPRSFHLYVTHVDGERHFLRISGQLDQQASLMIESLFEAARENLEKGVGAAIPGSIHEGIICAAKYKDGTYYRAKVINMTNIATGLVGVHFIDFGNKDIISLSTIRFLDNYDPLFLQLRGQATDFYLSRVINPTGRWEEPMLMKLQSLLCYSEYPVTLDAHTHTLPLVSIQFKGNDLSTHLISIRFGMAIPVAKQEVLLLQVSESQHVPNWQSNFLNDAPAFSEHVPFLLNQSFPANPASAMRMQQNAALPFNGRIPATQSLISKRLLNNKVPRTSVNLKAPARQPQHSAGAAGLVLSTPPPATTAPPFPAVNPTSPKKCTTYKSKLLEVNSQHKVFISYAEEGPELFAVQLVSEATKLQDMMDEINRRPHSSLAEPPMIGTVCLGRMSDDRIICRAIVMNLSGSQCKLFFVDFGDTEMISYYDIFDIPEEFVKPNVYAMRFCLSGVKKLEKGPQLNEAFKQMASGKVLTLKVVAPEGPPLIQYGELYLDDKNILQLLMANMKDKSQFKWPGTLPSGSKQSVLVSYVDSCIKFYIQLSDKIEELNAVMEAVKLHCENSSSPGELPAGAACCARFPDDGNWYRAQVRSAKDGRVTVAYVDYGNEQEVSAADLRSITPDLIRLPAVAMKCALKGFESRPVETKTSNQLEMLALEKTLVCHVVGALPGDAMLVTLVDDAAAPPLDVARKMAQLSQPRASHEVKPAPAPARRESGEAGSPEGAGAGAGADEARRRDERRQRPPEDAHRPPHAHAHVSSPESAGGERRAGLRRERSFKEPRPAAGLRARDKDGSFERAPGGRHAPGGRPGGRPDRPERPDRHDRRGGGDGGGGGGGGKPWESRPAAGARDCEQPAEQPAAPRAPARDPARDRRKPREGAARVAAGAGAGEAGAAPRASVQDRLRRDRFHQPEERDEKRNDDWGNRSGGARGERRDRRGGRGARPGRGHGHGHASPRERAERSFDDTRSERSGGGGGGRLAQAQPRELAQPAPPGTEFPPPAVEAGVQLEVAVTWIVSPECFYVQPVAQQGEFLAMMHSIPEAYRGVRPLASPPAAGACVLARYPPDGVLYRAVVLQAEPGARVLVQYVDFGNKQAVDARDVWQLDERLARLPRMAVRCALAGVAPPPGGWRAGPDLDRCFAAPTYRCAFHEPTDDGGFRVFLWSDGLGVADALVEKQLAAPAEERAAATLKDEPIELSVLAGQQLVCRVTHVRDHALFHAQLDLDKAARLHDSLAAYDVSKLRRAGAELATEGAHCTLVREGRVCRAVLRAVDAAAGTVTALLPDCGDELSAAIDDVLILPAELSVYYYQALPCTLHNYTPAAEPLLSAAELRARLEGNKFLLYVDDVDGTTLVTTLYELDTGRKVCAFAPDEGAHERVALPSARAVLGRGFGRAFVSHAAALRELYLQRSADAERLARLLEDLYAFYEEGAPEPLPEPELEPEAPCAAKSSDGNWYRAAVVAVEDERVTVRFSDYGNCESVDRRALRKLDPRFHEPCCLALVAGLGLEPAGEAALAALRDWTADKELQVTLDFGDDGGWRAGLHLDGVDLARKLVEEGLATVCAGAPAEQELEQEAPPQEAPPAGYEPMTVSHIDSPGQFWLQSQEQAARLEALQAELQADAAAYPELQERAVGALCAARYLADELWYRAEVLDADADITTVRFVDYGNTDVLDARPGLLRELPERLRAAERCAARAALNAVPSGAGTGEWSEPAAELFAALAGGGAPLHAAVVLRGATTYVDVFARGADVTARLVAAGHAARAEPAPAGAALPACFASHVNSPAEFWLQLEAAVPELNAVEDAMADAETFPPLPERAEGALCAARYPEDGAWYRAQVVVDGSEGTEVLFVDYGNASLASELRALPAELQRKPALSRKCALQKPRDIAAWSRRSEERFEELAAEGATVFSVQFVAAGDISIVELYLDGEPVAERLAALCEGRAEPGPPAERPPPLGRELAAGARLCYVHSAEEFYVHADEALPAVERTAETLAAGAELAPAPELRVGALCAAFWPEDERWYRARVLGFCDAGYRVRFLDYGNEAECAEVRALPAPLEAAPPLARACRLPANAPAGARDALDRLALEDRTLQLEYLDTSSEPALVRVLVDGLDLLSTLSADDTHDTVPAVPAVLDDIVPNVLDDAVSKVLDDSVPGVLDNAVPALLDNTVSAVLDDSVPTVLDDAVSKVLDSIVPAVLNDSVHAVLDNTVTADLDDSVLAVLDNTVPFVADNTVPAVHDNTLPAVLDNTVPAVLDNTLPAVLDSTVPVIPDNTVPAVLDDTVSAVLDNAVPAVLDDTSDERKPEDTGAESGVEAAHARDVDEDEFGDAEDGADDKLDTSQPDLDGSMDSTQTVIENRRDVAPEDVTPDEGIHTDTPSTPGEGAAATTPDRSDSIDSPASANTDAGYTSGDPGAAAEPPQAAAAAEGTGVGTSDATSGENDSQQVRTEVAANASPREHKTE